jgi:hypothetical protein
MGVSSWFSYWLREGVFEYLIFAMSINDDSSNEKKTEGKIDQISIFIHEEETIVEIQFLETSKDLETKIRISESLREAPTPEEGIIRKPIEYKIQEVEIKCGNNPPEPLEKVGEFYILNCGIENPKVIVHLSNISFEREFNLLIVFASNSFTISKVDINTESYIPIYVSDGEFSSPRSILFKNPPSQMSFKTFCAFRRVSMNITVFLATFSIMMGVIYFLLPHLLGFKHKNKPYQKSEESSSWEEYRRLWKECYEQKRHGD